DGTCRTAARAGIQTMIPEFDSNTQRYPCGVKLCRFEVKAEPGRVRSGMVYSGKVYETNGSEAIAVYEADQVRPLTPIPNAPTLRIFRSDLQGDLLDAQEPLFFYSNPTSLFGTSQMLAYPEMVAEVGFECFMAAVLVSDAFQISPEQADDIVLAYTMLTLLVGRGMERI